MTETTSIQQFMRERHAYAPIVHQPGLATFVAQAAIGSFCGSFVVFIARILLVYHSYNGLYIFYLPFLMVLGLATGVTAGFLIWAATKEADGPLLGITRSLLGVLVMALAWFALWYFLFKEDISSEKQLWMLTGVVASGASIGLVTGSRLRPWRELIRGGETKATVLKILAGLIGLVLRSVVVFCFLVTLVVAITTVQFYYLGRKPPDPSLTTFMAWSLLALGHFTAGIVVLFKRMRLRLLALLAVIAALPILATLWVVEMGSPERYLLIGYLGAWAMFLLTRWRQTDIAWSNLKEELRYYLID